MPATNPSHKMKHTRYIPTLAEQAQMIADWQAKKVARSQAVRPGAVAKPNNTTMKIYLTILRHYRRMGVKPAQRRAFSDRWAAVSQYGYPMGPAHDTRKGALRAALSFYADNLHFIS